MKHKFATLIVVTTLVTTDIFADVETRAPAPGPVNIDREQAFVGKREFKIVNDGNEAGMITVHSRFTDAGHYLVHDHSASEAMGVEEELLMVLDGDSFAPVRVQVHGRFGPQYLDVNWEWQGQLANGKADTYNFETGAHAHHDLDRELPQDTLTRGAALFLANAMEVEAGKTIEFNWFNT
jgi:hypothetical protein